MPIHIIRDVALTIRSFYKRINDFVKYRQATRDMNDRYPDASPEEVAREEVCIICRDNMRAWAHPAPTPNPPDANAQQARPPTTLDERTRPKKLPCGHILHFGCLRSWLERQQNCPTCRRPVLATETASSAGEPNVPNANAGAAPAPNQQQVPHAAHGAGHRPPIVHQNVFNLGPIRFAFGARIGQGPPQPNENNPAAPNQPQIPGGVPGLTNPFNLFGQPQAQQPTNARFTPANVPAQLHQIEQQLMREVNALRAQSDQLYLVRALQGELARLRIQQAQGNQGHMSTQARHVHTTRHGLQAGAFAPASANQPPNLSQVFTSGQEQQSMGSGHPDLPPGMTLPEGWTVLPLQRIAPADSGTNDAPTASTSSQQPPLQGSAPSSETHASTASSPGTTAPDSRQSNEINNVTQLSPAIPQSTPAQLPSLDARVIDPTSSVPVLPPEIPRWGSAPLPQSNAPESTTETKIEQTPTAMNGTAHPSNGVNETEYSSAERREAKGKGKAVTVEDLNEDVD